MNKLRIMQHLVQVKGHMNFLKKLSFLVVLAALFCVYAVGQLLYVLLVFISNPCRALRKTARDSKQVLNLSIPEVHVYSAFSSVQSLQRVCWTPVWVPTSM